MRRNVRVSRNIRVRYYISPTLTDESQVGSRVC